MISIQLTESTDPPTPTGSCESPLRPPTPFQSIDPVGVMSRMDWFRELKSLYSSLLTEKDQVAKKRHLLEALNRAQLPLRQPQSYYCEETDKAFSFGEVRKAICDVSDVHLSWDQVIDAIFSIGMQGKAASPTNSTAKDSVTTLNQYQSIVSSPLKTQLCASILILNLSHCKLREFELNCLLPTLYLLNLSHNSLQKLSMLQRCKGLKEAYLCANRLTAVSSLCHLDKLKLLDLTENMVNSFENIACLAVNCKLKALKLAKNPICKRAEYRQTVHMLLPTIQHLDPESIYAFTQFAHRRKEAFGDIYLQIQQKRGISRENVEIRSKMSQTPKPSRPDSRNTSPKQVRPQTPQLKPTYKPAPEYTGSRHKVHQSLDEALSVLAEAEKRLEQGHVDTEVPSSKHHHSISMITAEAIEKAHSQRYGNPVAALMIGPPAGTRKRKPSKLRKENRCSPLPLAKQSRKPLIDHNSRIISQQCVNKKG